ncbi:MAG: sulfite exporter TauE/SafE family protein [Rhizobiales bacterium]|nr:sulfite exporter TauE/SafE family protein [Hyphomicrobiales bacterium]
MFFGVPYDQLAILAVGLLGAGAATGVLAGVFGVGGGAVIVPVLYELFGVVGVPLEVRMPLCVGTSLAIIIPTSIRSFQAHKARGAVDLDVLKAWAVPVVLGVVIGSFIARYAPPAVFKAVFVFVAGLSAFRLLTGKELKFGKGMPGKAGMAASGGVIGVLSSLMGIGGGQLGNLVMMAYGRSIHNAIATSSGLGVLISIPGAIGYIFAGWSKAAEFPGVAALQFPFALGYVSLIGFLLFIPTSIWTAPLGARLAHALPKRRLEVAFGLFLLIVCLRFLWDFIAR